MLRQPPPDGPHRYGLPVDFSPVDQEFADGGKCVTALGRIGYPLRSPIRIDETRSPLNVCEKHIGLRLRIGNLQALAVQVPFIDRLPVGIFTDRAILTASEEDRFVHLGWPVARVDVDQVGGPAIERKPVCVIRRFIDRNLRLIKAGDEAVGVDPERPEVVLEECPAGGWTTRCEFCRRLVDRHQVRHRDAETARLVWLDQRNVFAAPLKSAEKGRRIVRMPSGKIRK